MVHLHLHPLFFSIDKMRAFEPIGEIFRTTEFQQVQEQGFFKLLLKISYPLIVK